MAEVWVLIMNHWDDWQRQGWDTAEGVVSSEAAARSWVAKDPPRRDWAGPFLIDQPKKGDSPS